MSKIKKNVPPPQPKASKEPKYVFPHPNNNFVTFSFCKIDNDEKFPQSFCHCKEKAFSLIQFLQSISVQTWGELRGDKSHSVEKLSVAPHAYKQLQQMHLDDCELFSLRLRGKARIWGIEYEKIFYMLWWDPEHKICPSTKKHT